MLIILVVIGIISHYIIKAVNNQRAEGLYDWQYGNNFNNSNRDLNAFMDQINQQDFEANMNKSSEYAMQVSEKAITPFDHGGDLMGYGFNHSDTLSQDAMNQGSNMSSNMSLQNMTMNNTGNTGMNGF